MPDAIRVLVVDDHQIVREGLRTLFAGEPGVEVVGEASDGIEAIAAALELKPDVVLMDLVMPGCDGIECTRRIRAELPDTQVLVLTSFAGDAQVHEALKAGAIGYLLKDVSRAELARALESVRRGLPTLHAEAQRQLVRGVAAPERSLLAELTERERQVLELIARGHSNKAIATTLRISEGTVKGYVSAMLCKLGVADRTQAALYAVKHGLIATGDL